MRLVLAESEGLGALRRRILGVLYTEMRIIYWRRHFIGVFTASNNRNIEVSYFHYKNL
jgi:hypothetical protein